jgi:hypothetical protein
LKKLQSAPTCLPLIVLSAAAALAGCGSGSSGDRQAEVVAAIEEVMSHPKPADCRTLETPGYLKQTKREEGKTSTQKCEDDARQGAGEAVEVSQVVLEGTKALAHVKFEGGTSAGLTALVALVEDEDRWELDEVVRFVDFDSARVIDSLESQLARSFDHQIAACVASGLRRVPTARFEDAFLHLARLQALIVNSAIACAHSDA